MQKNLPKLTAMLQGRTPERFFELIRKGLAGGADAFGLQLEHLERQYRTSDVYKEIFKRMEQVPAYVTNYRCAVNDGKTDDELAEELLMLAECGAEILDVMGDMFCVNENQITYDPSAVVMQKKLIEELHSMKKRVLMSSHVSSFMTYEEVYRIAYAQKERGADVAKIVTAVSSKEELDTAFETTARLNKELGIEFLYLCTGEHSFLHRRIAPMIAGGMFLCAVEYDDLSTLAQPLLGEAQNMIKLLCGDKR